ncbi:TBC1 domain family member 22B-like isoform X3 [Hypanus sabinus]|uniref:TBC1 domain family member 22B-like isoform X3 n=1 Tax=Hypanus sabinus TaxID=79690 RepID=UPI0028C379CB|nr:TBC1 domain family member 22B-like isoform X3 [Hypanus sabinus]
MANENRRQFWKRNSKVPGSIQQVYGAQHPPFDPRLHKNLLKEGSKMYTQSKSKRASSFHEFAKSTSDAWDIGDDEEEEFLSVASQNLNSKVAMATAAQVIQNHNKLKDRPGEKLHQSESIDEAKTNGKVVKSNSEVQLSKSSEELRKYSWSGVPRDVRSVTWRLLSGYLPANMERREITLQRKREEYFGFIEQYYDSRNEEHHQDTYRQIHIDIPRTNPLIPLFQQPSVQEIFERILFIWAIRHPASGYVQGINDLVTPFFVVFLSEHVEEDVENFDVTNLSEDVQRNIEADSFWCMSKLLDGIQDNYTFAQPGIQKKVKALEELISRIDEQVHFHFRKYEVEYLQFAFRWMNNLLMRELPLRCTIRLWDTYQSEPEGFSHFHLYVCAAFLIKWRKEILEEDDFQGLLMLLQNLPTIHWGNEEVGLLLAEAYRLKYMFADAPNHYRR